MQLLSDGMDKNIRSMDKNQHMKLLTLEEIRPTVRVANYHLVAKGDHWTNRRIPDLEFILVVAGEYEYITEDQQRSISPGDVLFIEPGILHTKQICTDCERGRLSAIHMELLPGASWLTGEYRLTPTPDVVTRVNDFDYLHARFRKLAEIYADYVPFREEQMSTIAHEIMVILAGHWQNLVRDRISPRMQAMINYIRENLHRPINRQDLAAQINVTPAYVNMIFKRELGTTPSALINRERMIVAYHLISDQGLLVQEAAHRVGFEDPFYFSRVFHHIMGIAPSKVAQDRLTK
jgi:AraC-like DNA-binding protein